MILSDYAPRKRHDILWQALDFVLQDSAGDKGTAEIAETLRHRLACPATELPLVMTWLKKVAPLVPEAAQTGAVVKAYGNYGRRWIWSKRAGLAPVAAVDTADW